MKIESIKRCVALIAALVGICVASYRAWAHCDSLGGPVIRDARLALERGVPDPVLKWVSKEHEDEIRDAFKQTMAVRAKGDDARELADRYFFESLVRIHRAGEGEPFTGLKPAGSVDPGIAEADKALQTGSAKVLERDMAAAVDEGIGRRFAVAIERKKHAADSVEAGRKFVEAYVDYIHFVESVHLLVSRGAPHTHPDSLAHADR